MSTFKKPTDRLINELQKALEFAKGLQRLPKTCVPNQYTICLKPNIEDNTFEGSESINITLSSNTKHIILHSVDLVITKVMWEEDITENRQEPVEIQTDRDKSILKMMFDPFLIPSQGCLRINFKGRITDRKLVGLYRINAKNATPTAGTVGEKPPWTLVTRFEPIDARRVFPCWDEPDIKATFDIFLIVPKDKTVLSNMEEKVCYPHKKNAGLKIVEFKRTPKMTTCLTGFVIGDFEYLEAVTKDNVLCRVYTPIGKMEDGKFALDVTLKILPYFKNYFGIAYPLSKLFLVGIADLSSASQDNWGLLMLRQVNLLVNDSTAGASDRQYISLLIAQGISHQWFGNLTTQSWWSDVFLKEGFATFAKYIGVDQIFPEFDIWSQFVDDVHLRSMRMDALKSSHPVHMDVLNPADMDALYDDIEYKKSAALLRMLHRYVGDADFRKGMKKYLTKYQYSSASAEDLWNVLEECSSKPVHAVMNNWTKQKGFPIVKVTGRQDGKNRVLKLSQDRFSGDPVMNLLKGQKDLWMIPLTIATGNKPNKVVKEMLMDTRNLTVTITDVDKNQWVKLNPGTVGYYRVRYPQEMLAQFIPAVRSKTMMPLDRLGLLDDSFALVQAGFSPTVEVLSLTEAFVEEDEYIVWQSINQMFDKLLRVFGHVEFTPKLKTFGRYIYTYIYDKLGWEPESDEGHLQTLLRTLVLRQMTKLGHDKAIEKASEMFDLMIKKGVEIPVDLRYVVYNAVLSRADDEMVKLFLKMYKESDSVEEKDRMANAMGSLTNSKHVKIIVEFAMTDEVRKQDAVVMMTSISKSKAGRDILWNYLKENWPIMKGRFSGSFLRSIIKGVTDGFFTEEKANDVADFSRDHTAAGMERIYNQAIEGIRINDAWYKRENSNTMMKDFLESFS